MVQDLKHYLADNPCRGFQAIPHYFPQGDYLTFYATDERCYAERVDDLLTVYLSLDTKKLGGFKINGVRRLFTELDSVGLSVQSDDLSLEMFFVMGKSHGKRCNSTSAIRGGEADGEEQGDQPRRPVWRLKFFLPAMLT